MRTICLLLLSCAFPFIALSQTHPTDKAIIDDYAHPAFARVLQAPGSKIIIDEDQRLYLAAAADASVFTRPQDFVVVKQLSPTHAIIRISSSINAGRLFQYMLPANNAWKASPGLLQHKNNVKQVMLAVKDLSSFKTNFSNHLQVIQEYRNINAIVVQLNNITIDSLLASDEVLFADMAIRTPKEELIVSGFDLGTNFGNTTHYHFPAVTGEGLMVSVKEHRFDTTDIDLKGRVVNSGLASATGSGHATIMATMMAGAGNTYFEGKGYAWKAGLQSVTFANLMPEPDAYYNSQRISVQNHSYGTGIENFYGADAAAYDATVINNPVLMHVFSSGNSGLAASAGPYAGITGYANLTGSFKMAKNILVVGAIDSLGNIEGPSSKGPAYDGRIKPELVAFGQDGSSGSAAIVSGIVLLLQHAYQQQQQGTLPAASLVKAILINAADDVGTKGPDFASGYGNANAYQALRALQQSRFFSNSIQQGNTQTFNLTVPANISSLKLTLAWTDPAATANTARALINDLDLELAHVASGQNWQPWVLSRFPNIDSLKLPAVRNRDTLNNVEQVTVDAPPAGDYIVRVKGSRITNSQSYFVAYGADTLNTFEWRYPMKKDPVQGGTGVLLRWKAVFNTNPPAQLQYSLDGNTWQNISTNPDLSRNYFRWNVPDTFSTAFLRMTIGGNTYVTDTFVISKLFGTAVGFNCPDSFLFYWNRPKGVDSFRIYKLGSKFLEPVTITTDTFYLGSKATAGSQHFTVAPILNNQDGIKAYTFDYTSQGVECYFKSFLALLSGNLVNLDAELGSLYNVKRITAQKLVGNQFKDLSFIDNPAALQLHFEDAQPHQGVNTYRLALLLADGRIIYSHTEVVFYLNNTDYLIYPNPVRAGSTFKIQQREPEEIRILVYDATGRLIKNGTYSDVVNPVNIAGLQKGLYVVAIEKEGVRVFRGKVIIN